MTHLNNLFERITIKEKAEQDTKVLNSSKKLDLKYSFFHFKFV